MERLPIPTPTKYLEVYPCDPTAQMRATSSQPVSEDTERRKGTAPKRRELYHDEQARHIILKTKRVTLKQRQAQRKKEDDQKSPRGLPPIGRPQIKVPDDVKSPFLSQDKNSDVWHWLKSGAGKVAAKQTQDANG